MHDQNRLLVSCDRFGAFRALQLHDFRRQLVLVGLCEQARDQWPQDKEHQSKRGQDKCEDLTDADEVELVELERSRRFATVQPGIGPCEGCAFDGDNVTAFGIEQHRRFHQRRNAGDLLRRAVLPSGRRAVLAGDADLIKSDSH